MIKDLPHVVHVDYLVTEQVLSIMTILLFMIWRIITALNQLQYFFLRELIWIFILHVDQWNAKRKPEMCYTLLSTSSESFDFNNTFFFTYSPNTESICRGRSPVKILKSHLTLYHTSNSENVHIFSIFSYRSQLLGLGVWPEDQEMYICWSLWRMHHHLHENL